MPFCFGRGCLKRYEKSSVSFLAAEAEIAAVVFAGVDLVYHFHVRYMIKSSFVLNVLNSLNTT